MAKGVKTGGRVKGTPNKNTVAVKEALSLAFDAIGGVDALSEWSRENPTEFYKLWVKQLPTELSGSVNLTNIPLPEQDKALLEEYASGKAN